MAYQVLGHFGRAIVLALQNEAQKSNDLFAEVGGSLKRQKFDRSQPLVQYLFSDVQLRDWIRKALEYNAENLKQKTPQELEYLLHPPRNPGPGRLGGVKKQSGKGT